MNKNVIKVSCIILAGGEGKRVGGVDKGLLEYRGKPLIEHVIKKVSPQVDDIVISANRNTKRYELYSQKVIIDESVNYLGPMAGINAALPHCQHDRVLIVACDTPFLPSDMINRFISGQTGAQLHIASTNKRLQLAMLIHKNLHDSISHSLNEGQLRLIQWAKSQQPEIVEFEDGSAFKNFNYTDDFDS